MTLLIGTDEAGYGPTLGPLVIVATAWKLAWRVPHTASVEQTFAPFQDGFEAADGRRVAIGDSKKIFKPKLAGGLDALESTVAAFGDAFEEAFAKGCAGGGTLSRFLMRMCRDDHGELCQFPWYADLDVPFPLRPTSDCEHLRAVVRQTMAASGVELVDVAARVIDPAPFNRLCEAAGNKATLLSEATLQLASRLIDAVPSETNVHVFSDRHGGRHRYGGLLLHTRPEGLLQILREGSPESRYRLCEPERSIDWRFTVGGDRFVPVALASMFAKYLRERLMERFNAFWQSHHAEPLTPTAGYPTDAGRFCQQIDPIASRMGIDSSTYIRSR